MGALHEGHLHLIKKARQRSEIVVVSIYVNPSQFGPKEDFTKYPRTFARDAALCRQAGVDVIFNPANLYLPDHSTWVVEEKIATGRCSRTRPGHFRGVATVVLKLFNLVQPTQAYFGWKDAQQVGVIQRLVRDLQVPIRIIPIETVRDRDGLALSSRNRYLSPLERERALALPLLLHLAVRQKKPVAWLQESLGKCPGIRLDYVEWAEGRLCAAIWVGKTRLIDNLKAV
jgi:pantoate--beta-alanine ligase